MKDYKQQLEIFAEKHGLKFKATAGVGFGRSCTGFVKGAMYVGFNPIRHPEYNHVFPEDTRLEAPADSPDAYHKHDCLCVLIRDGDVTEAHRQLLAWVKHLEAIGPLVVSEYDTGREVLQGFPWGEVGFCIRFADTV